MIDAGRIQRHCGSTAAPSCSNSDHRSASFRPAYQVTASAKATCRTARALRRRSVKSLAVNAREAPRDRFRGEGRQRIDPPCLTEVGAHVGSAEKGVERARERPGVAWRDEYPGPVVMDDVGDTSEVEGNDGRAAQQRLHGDGRHPLAK